MTIAGAVASGPGPASGTASVQTDLRKQTPSEEARDRAAQPPPRAPLPPGQGRRIDILA